MHLICVWCCSLAYKVLNPVVRCFFKRLKCVLQFLIYRHIKMLTFTLLRARKCTWKQKWLKPGEKWTIPDFNPRIIYLKGKICFSQTSSPRHLLFKYSKGSMYSTCNKVARGEYRRNREFCLWYVVSGNNFGSYSYDSKGYKTWPEEPVPHHQAQTTTKWHASKAGTASKR